MRPRPHATITAAKRPAADGAVQKLLAAADRAAPRVERWIREGLQVNGEVAGVGAKLAQGTAITRTDDRSDCTRRR